MNQLLFEFGEPVYPRFDKFLGNANRELLHILQQEHDQFIYIWGEEGAGKSHILQAWVGQAAQKGANAAYIDASRDALSENMISMDFVAVDNVNRLDSNEQMILFNLFNHFRNTGKGYLLVADDKRPAQLSLREDLRTRMAYCLVYEVKSLSDEEKIDALNSMARARQMDIDPKIFQYLLLYWRRDMDSLMQMFNDLERYSLTLHKPITLPLLRQLLKQQEMGEQE